MSTANRERIHEYDLIRVILTITVVFGHSLYLEWGGDNGFITCVSDMIHPINAGTYCKALGFLQSWVYHFHMPAFFMLSGACFSGVGDRWSIRDLDGLVKRKFKRLIVPVLLTTFLYMFPIKRLAGFYDNASLLSSINFVFSGANVYGHLWFPIALFWIFILFSLIMMAVGKRSAALGLLVCLLLEGFYSQYLSSFTVLGLYLSPLAFANLKYFAIGFYFGRYREKVSALPGKLVIGVGLIALSFLSVYNEWNGLSPLFGTTVFSIAVAFGLYCICAELCKTGIMENRCFKLLLDSNFYIYLFHDPLNFIWIKVAQVTGVLRYAWGVVGFYAMRFIGAIVLSILLYKLLTLVRRAGKKTVAAPEGS